MSESELAFALKAAAPTNLKPQQLKEWFQAKKVAQQKVLERVQEASSFLSSGENTLSDWVEFDQARQINAEQAKQQPAGAAPPSGADPQQTGAVPPGQAAQPQRLVFDPATGQLVPK